MPTNYGTNNRAAFTDLCPVTGEKHKWKFSATLGRCYESYACPDCGATCSVDSSD